MFYMFYLFYKPIYIRYVDGKWTYSELSRDPHNRIPAVITYDPFGLRPLSGERDDKGPALRRSAAHRALVVYHRQRPLGSLILLPLRDVGIERQIRPARMEALNQIVDRDFPRWRRLDKPREGHCGHVHCSFPFQNLAA